MPIIKTAGRYDVTVKAVDIDQPAGKDPSVRLIFATASGDEITAWLNLKTTYSAGAKMSAFEVSLKTLREAFGFDDDFSRLSEQVLGREASIVVELEPYENPKTRQTEDRAKVKWINRVGGGLKAAVVPPASALSALTAAAKRIALPAGAPAAPPRTPSRPAAAPPNPDTEEDVPF